MKIKKMNKNKVVMFLTQKDAINFGLDFKHLSLEKDKRLLLRLLSIASLNCDIDLEGKEVLMEALPGEDGIILFFTFERCAKKRNIYYLMKIRGGLGFSFSTLEDFLGCSEKLCKVNTFNKNSAYIYEDKYYLVFDSPLLPKNAKIIITEYCKSCTRDLLFLAKIKERGNLICDKNALKKIGCAFCSEV